MWNRFEQRKQYDLLLEHCAHFPFVKLKIIEKPLIILHPIFLALFGEVKTTFMDEPTQVDFDDYNYGNVNVNLLRQSTVINGDGDDLNDAPTQVDYEFDVNNSG